MLAKYGDMVDDNNNDYFRKFHRSKESLIGVALKGVIVSNCLSKSNKDSILNKKYEEVAVMEYLPYYFFFSMFYKNFLIYKESNRQSYKRQINTIFFCLNRVKGNDLKGIILVIKKKFPN